jgi:hypothetical protein
MSTGEAGEPTRGAAREAVVEELRALGLLALDRLDPLVNRLSESVAPERDDPAGPRAGHRCTSCPVCAVLTDVRTDRGDAVAEVARHATGLLAALREVLSHDRSGRGGQAPSQPFSSVPDPIVQRIPVERIPVERAASGDGVPSC